MVVIAIDHATIFSLCRRFQRDIIRPAHSADSFIFVAYTIGMEVTDDMINNLAALSRLQFNELEKEEIKKDLQRMISFVEKLNEVDTTGVEPLLHMSEVMNVYREDRVEGSMQKSEALANAPSSDKDFFKVPKVIRNPGNMPENVK